MNRNKKLNLTNIIKIVNNENDISQNLKTAYEFYYWKMNNIALIKVRRQKD